MTIQEKVDLLIKRIEEMQKTSIYDDFDGILAGRYDRDRRRNTCYDKLPLKNKSTKEDVEKAKIEKDFTENRHIRNDIDVSELKDPELIRSVVEFFSRFFNTLDNDEIASLSVKEACEDKILLSQLKEEFLKLFIEGRGYTPTAALKIVWKVFKRNAITYFRKKYKMNFHPVHGKE